MKANELMVGDWVKVTHIDGSSDFARVSQVGTREIKTRDKNGYMQLYAMPMFEPIPLTEDILLANGFEKMNEHSYKHPTNAVFERYGNRVLIYRSNTICEIHKVHELQHALRIVGLTDLADNFKVE